MTKTRNSNLRMGWRTAAAISLAVSWPTATPAGDMSSVGAASRPALIALDPEPPGGRPIYRLPDIDPNASTNAQIETALPFEAYTTPQVDEQSVTPVDEPESESYGPTITILPPIDPLPSLPVIEESVIEETQPSAPAGPMITILPPCDPPLELAAPTAEPVATVAPAEPIEPVEPVAPAEPTNELADDFDAAWNEEIAPTPPAPTPPPQTLTLLPPTTPPPTRQLPTLLPPITSPPTATLPPETAPIALAAPPRVTPYAPSTAELSRQLLPTVRRAYGLAQHGAVYAAQTEFIQVLRRIAESKDAAEGVDAHAQALAAGMRALDEADDFAPRGSQLEGDLNVAVVASAHRTPALLGTDVTLRPAEAIALYHQYARQQLARAVAGEQAGSMALYGLGKVQNRLSREGDGQLQHERKALVMFAASLDAGPGNHLAANEIGVLLSRAGYPAAASELFRRAIDLSPTSTGYHNLAVTDRALGYHEQASANELYAQQLAQRDRLAGASSRAKGVEWVAPQDMSLVTQPLPMNANQNYARQNQVTGSPQLMPQPVGAVETATKWPQKLVPGIFRR